MFKFVHANMLLLMDTYNMKPWQKCKPWQTITEPRQFCFYISKESVAIITFPKSVIVGQCVVRHKYITNHLQYCCVVSHPCWEIFKDSLNEVSELVACVTVLTLWHFVTLKLPWSETNYCHNSKNVAFLIFKFWFAFMPISNKIC